MHIFINVSDSIATFLKNDARGNLSKLENLKTKLHVGKFLVHTE